MRRAVIAAALLAACLAPRPARAQTSADLLARGMRAVQNLDYDSAATFLRGALSRVGTDGLPDSSRARALMWLGATEFFRDKRDSAVVIFGRLLVLDPRYRPDQLVFPPEVSSLFQEVRSGTRAIAIVVQPVTELVTAGDRMAVRLYATSIQEITVNIQHPGAGAPVLRQLYAGAIGDSLQLLWDARDSSGTIADGAGWVLRVSPRGGAARAMRAIEMPLDVRVTRRDTVSLPGPLADSLFRPERSGAGGSARALAGGLATAVAALVLPSIVSSGSPASGTRFVVAAASGVVGVIGFSARHHPLPIPANIAANQVMRLAWQRRVDVVHADNEARRRDIRIVVRAGEPHTVQP